MKRKHSTARRRISNLPFTELYSRHNEAVTHRPPAQLCLPAGAIRLRAHWIRCSGHNINVNSEKKKDRNKQFTMTGLPFLIQRAASPLRPRGPGACSCPVFRSTESTLHKKKTQKKSIGDSFSLRVDKSFYTRPTRGGLSLRCTSIR